MLALLCTPKGRQELSESFIRPALDWLATQPVLDSEVLLEIRRITRHTVSLGAFRNTLHAYLVVVVTMKELKRSEGSYGNKGWCRETEPAGPEQHIILHEACQPYATPIAAGKLPVRAHM